MGDAAGADGLHPADGGSDAGTKGDSTPLFIGRFDTRDAAGPRFAYPGSAIRARFTGTTLTLKLRDPGRNQFQIFVDGKAGLLLKPSAGQESYVVASGLPAGTHDVEVYRRTEASFGTSQFLGFVPAPGEQMLPPSPPHTRRIEYVGDSITCGYGILGADATCHLEADTEDHYQTYAALAARALEADEVAVAWSGKGVAPNTSPPPINVLFERALPTDDKSVWDFTRFVPDVVVINIGTNDYAGTADPGSGFTDPYKALVSRIRAVYPKATIVSSIGPMLFGTQLAKVESALQSVVDGFHAAGDAKVFYLKFTPQIAADGLGCDYHPTRATHQKMANTLADFLRAKLAW